MAHDQIIVNLHSADLICPDTGVADSDLTAALCHELGMLDIKTTVVDTEVQTSTAGEHDVRISAVVNGKKSNDKKWIVQTLIEKVLQQIAFDFEKLPLLVEGESKIIRLLNDKIVVERFKPTVYSYTHNRYGIAKGTEALRVFFTSEVFRKMNAYAEKTGIKLDNAFLACIESESGPLLVQRKVDVCNLEVRVKRYHIGSPVHRYRFTDQYPTNHQCGVLKPWSRFDVPIVCFDWRHPLTDGEGTRLADEPISDDYAAVWMKDINTAKILAREAFLWLEQLFGKADLVLVDLCFFVDQSGNILFGEISPDCMRVREQAGNPGVAGSFDKDIWRKGEKSVILSERYEKLFKMVFNTLEEKYNE